MLWSVIRLIFKMSLVTPDFFYVFHLILSFSTCSQSFKKICAWELLGANVLKYVWNVYCVITNHKRDLQPQKIDEFPFAMKQICFVSKGLKINPLFQFYKK